MGVPKIRVLPDPAAVALAAARFIVDAAANVLAERDTFSIALSGGRTPAALYELLASDAFASRVDWSKVHVYFSDERCVPPDAAESNFRLAASALLDHVPIPYTQVHRLRGEIDPRAAADEYNQLLRERFGPTSAAGAPTGGRPTDESSAAGAPTGGSPVAQSGSGLDLVLLGMGEDGHTASLFPGTTALSETEPFCVANHVPKLDAWRLTMTAPFINRAARVLVMVTGAEKATRVQQALEGEGDPRELPIRLINAQQGEMVWLMDAPAAGMA